MALITCMSESRRGLATAEDRDIMVEEIAGLDRVQQGTHEDADSGCECSLEEVEGMDAWARTIVAIRVLTAFKKRRKKRLEEEKERERKRLEEEKEKAKKERRKTLWRRLGFKLRVFNMFATKINPDDPAKERLRKLKRKLGIYMLRNMLLL